MRDYDQKELAEKIEKYNRGKLKGEELIEFEIKLSLDESLRSEVALYQLLDETLQYGRQKQLDQYLKQNASSRLTGNFWGRRFTLISALGILLTGMLLLYMEITQPGHQLLRFPAGQKEQQSSSKPGFAGHVYFNQTVAVRPLETASAPFERLQVVVREAPSFSYQWKAQQLELRSAEAVEDIAIYYVGGAQQFVIHMSDRYFSAVPDSSGQLQPVEAPAALDQAQP